MPKSLHTNSSGFHSCLFNALLRNTILFIPLIWIGEKASHFPGRLISYTAGFYKLGDKGRAVLFIGNLNGLLPGMFPQIIGIQQNNGGQWIFMKFHGSNGNGKLLGTAVSTCIDNGQITQFLDMILTGKTQALLVLYQSVTGGQ